MEPVVVPVEYKDVLDALLGFQVTSTAPTQVWQGRVPSSLNLTGTASTTQQSSLADTASNLHGQETPYSASWTGATPNENAEIDLDAATSPADLQQDDDSLAVAYSYEQDFMLSDQAPSNTPHAESELVAVNLTGVPGNADAGSGTSNSGGLHAAHLHLHPLPLLLTTATIAVICMFI